ncbi:MAG: M50 family metallopeptidase [Nitratireductor sp.]
MIYVPYDIFSDTIARSELRSDARMMAEEVGGSTMLWGGIWLVVSIAVILLCLRYAFRENSNLWGQGAAATADVPADCRCLIQSPALPPLSQRHS